MASATRENSRYSQTPGVVVLIEDDPQVRDSTALLLQQHGWLVAAAATPNDALALMATMQDDGRMPAGDMPCALISDQRLGLDIDGLEVLRQLRYECGDDLPAFLLTGENSTELRIEADQAKVAILRKPVAPDLLVQTLAEARHHAA